MRDIHKATTVLKRIWMSTEHLSSMEIVSHDTCTCSGQLPKDRFTKKLGAWDTLELIFKLSPSCVYELKSLMELLEEISFLTGWEEAGFQIVDGRLVINFNHYGKLVVKEAQE